MMINNFDIFKREFQEWYFYFIQLIIRWKDHWIDEIGNSNRARCVKTYYIYTKEELDRSKDKIIKLAEFYWARIYIHPAKRYAERICLELIKYLVDRLEDTNTAYLNKCYETVCGKHIPKKKIRVLDIDWVFIWDERVDKLIEYIEKQKWPDKKVIQVLPTKNWLHILTYWFDTQHLAHNNIISDITVQRNNPTLLYYNNKWTETESLPTTQERT